MIPDGWGKVPLADVCELFTDGDWIERKDQSSEGIRLVQTGSVGEGIFKNRLDKARFISGDTFARLKCTEIFDGDCLVSRLPEPVGRSCIIPSVGERMITAVDCTIIRFQTDRCIPEYFNYYTRSQEYIRDVDGRCTGTTRKRISRKNLGKIEIPLPPLLEQRRLVSLLDAAFAGLATATANTQKNLQNARELFESGLASVFSDESRGWVTQPLSELGKIQTGTTPKKDEQESTETGICFIKPGDFNADGTLNTTGNQLNPEKLKKARIVSEGSVLMVCIGATIGKTGFNTCPIITNQQINTLTPSTPIRARLLYYQMLLPDFQRKVIRSSGQATLPIINKGKWSQLPSRVLPSSDAEHQIVKRLDELLEQSQSMQAIAKSKLATLKELKQSILHRAFRGELSGDGSDINTNLMETAGA